MIIAVDRSEILRGLQILYPPEHGVIELDVLKKSGKLLTGHFDNTDKLLDEIEKYDAKNDVAAIYTGLNRIHPATFTRKDNPLKLNNKIARGQRTKSQDIERITGILFDLDPIRTNGDRKDSTTDEEHQAGLEAALWLKDRLSMMGWPEPVIGDSGNGGQLRYLTDLPATEEWSNRIKRALEAANSILPDRFRGKVEVDIAMHDRPRISKVFGTVTRKGVGTQERPHRRSKLISAPEKLEIVQLNSILKLIRAVRPADDTESPIVDKTQIVSPERTKNLAEVGTDPDVKPCIKDIALNKDIKRLEEVAAHEHQGRSPWQLSCFALAILMTRCMSFSAA
ncbi:MAG: hypothetical protein MUO26_06590 [Methanotrichaceae archaeon]|nr:hypothetical protein [Methanotrichaceae archaeon]